MSNFVIVYTYQAVGIVFVAYSIILMEAYALFLMIVAGAHLDILAMRLETLGHDMIRKDEKVNNRQFHVSKKSLLMDCLRVYAKIAR